MNLSIIIPAYNEAAQIADCLRSVDCQARDGDEIIVVDDGSTDRTAENTYAVANAIDTPVDILTHEQNQGVTPALNTGLAIAANAGILRIDADTQLGRGVLPALADALDAEADLALPRIKPSNIDALHPAACLAEKYAGRGRWYGGACHAVRRARLDEIGGYGEGRSAGTDRSDEMAALFATAREADWIVERREDLVVHSEFPTRLRPVLRRKQLSARTHAQRVREDPWPTVVGLRGPLAWTVMVGGVLVLPILPPVGLVSVLALVGVLAYYWTESAKVAEVSGRQWHRPAFVGYKVVGGLARTVGVWAELLGGERT